MRNKRGMISRAFQPEATGARVEVLFEILRNGENSAHHPRAWIKKLAARALANLGPEVDDGRAMRNEFMVEIPRTEDATSRLDVAEYALQVHELNLYCHLLKLSAEVDAKVSDELEVELLRCVNALYLARAQKVLAEWQEEDAARGSFSSIADGLSEYDGDPGSDGD